MKIKLQIHVSIAIILAQSAKIAQHIVFPAPIIFHSFLALKHAKIHALMESTVLKIQAFVSHAMLNVSLVETEMLHIALLVDMKRQEDNYICM